MQETADRPESTPSGPRVDTLLRILATRLTHVAEGRALVLDSVLIKLRQRLRGPLAEEPLQVLVYELTDAIRLLDMEPSAVQTAVTAATPDDEVRANAALLALIDALLMDETDANELEQARARIASTDDVATLTTQAEALAGFLNDAYRLRSEQRAAMQQLLAMVTRRLGELAQSLERDGADHNEGANARQALGRDLAGEIKTLDTRSHSASDLSSLQAEIQSRMAAITSHVKRFQEQEDARASAWKTRSEQLDRRIHDLERSAQTMEISLRKEHQLASTDPLTGIANRMVFEQRMAQVCVQLRQSGTAACLLVLDVDLFKQVNDRFGHAAGDRALCIVAQQLNATLRPEDLLARYGGEEFVVILPDTDIVIGQKIAERLRHQIEHTQFRGEQQPVRITVSCGITDLRDDDTPATVFERADRAVYLAKHNGRNRCETK